MTAEYGGRPLVTPTGRRLRSVEELHEILAEVRERGCAENREETALGLHALSVPVENGAGAILAALTMCVPTSRMNEERHVTIVADLLAAGARLSSEVAWLPSWNATRAE